MEISAILTDLANASQMPSEENVMTAGLDTTKLMTMPVLPVGAIEKVRLILTAPMGPGNVNANRILINQQETRNVLDATLSMPIKLQLVDVNIAIAIPLELGAAKVVILMAFATAKVPMQESL